MPHVIVIGGGITGVSTARDLAMRGCDVTLIDQGNLGAGTTGRSHGLLHSGARYADKDRAVAAECIQENRILKEIAPHCLTDTGGLFLSTPDDPADYPDAKRDACRDCGIPVTDDPSLPDQIAADIADAFAVPDAVVSPTRLTVATALSAEQHGATIRLDARVAALPRDGDQVTGVTLASGETLSADHVVNAAGPWSRRVASLAGADLPIALSGGVMAAVESRLPVVVNRCRPPSTGDIAVPRPGEAVLGTTSTRVDAPDAAAPDTGSAVATLRRELSALLPAVRDARLVRTFWGVRPLFSESGGDRTTSRRHAVVEHGPGFTSIIGGKLTTARVMAADTADAVCDALDASGTAATADEPLPGHDDPSVLERGLDRLGSDAPADEGGRTAPRDA